MIEIETKTDYPAGLQVEYLIHKAGNVPIKWKIRIPGWCGRFHVTINGEEEAVRTQDGFLILERQFQTGDVVTVAWVTQNRWSAWYRDSIAIERGPLVFALNMQENWKGFRECGGVTDYEVTSGALPSYFVIVGATLLPLLGCLPCCLGYNIVKAVGVPLCYPLL